MRKPKKNQVEVTESGKKKVGGNPFSKDKKAYPPKGKPRELPEAHITFKDSADRKWAEHEKKHVQKMVNKYISTL